MERHNIQVQSPYNVRTRVQRCKGARVQGCKGAKVQGCKAVKGGGRRSTHTEKTTTFISVTNRSRERKI